MSSLTPRTRIAIVLAALAVLTVALSASSRRPGAPARRVVELKASEETAPPGSMAQIKVFVTETTPITTGDAAFVFSRFHGSIEGIALPTAAVDAAGVAVVHGTGVAVSLVSPSATLGADSHYPILTVTGRIPADTPMGVVFPFVIDPEVLRLVDGSGVPYLTETDSGYLASAPGISVHDVVPGSAELSAGSVVSIYGSNFQPTTRIRFEGTILDLVRYVSANRIDVVLGQPALMHGMEIRAENRDGSRTTYFAYQRTRRTDTKRHAFLPEAVPLFSRRMMRTALLRFSDATAGVAVQNLQPSPVDALAELFTNEGTPVASIVMTLPSNQYILGEISEIFPVRHSGSWIVRVTAVTPIQVLGVAVDNEGRVTPRLPE